MRRSHRWLRAGLIHLMLQSLAIAQSGRLPTPEEMARDLGLPASAARWRGTLHVVFAEPYALSSRVDGSRDGATASRLPPELDGEEPDRVAEEVQRTMRAFLELGVENVDIDRLSELRSDHVDRVADRKIAVLAVTPAFRSAATDQGGALECEVEIRLFRVLVSKPPASVLPGDVTLRAELLYQDRASGRTPLDSASSGLQLVQRGLLDGPLKAFASSFFRNGAAKRAFEELESRAFEIVDASVASTDSDSASRPRDPSAVETEDDR